MAAQRNHYEILGVSPTANTDQIKTKYRELARKFHPDVVKDKALGQKIFTQINQAYRVLADPERRAQYDAGLRAGIPSANMPVGAGRATNPAAGKSGVETAGANRNGAGQADEPAAPTSPLSPNQQRAVDGFISNADFALMNGDAQAALDHCDNGLKLDPRNAKALGLRGDALAGLARPQEAAIAYRRSLEIAPSPMVREKLNRLGTDLHRTLPPQDVAGAQRTSRPGLAPTTRPSAPEPAASGGLFGRLLGKRK